MSLLSVRRERRESGFGAARRGARLWKLTGALVFVLLLFWYLGRFA
jgi:hypothetical protein